MADKVITATGDCSACCGGEPPAECPCVLQMPPAVETLFNNFGGVSVIMDDGQFIDYTEAAAAIADFVSNCIGWLWFYSQNAGNINSFSATNPASDTLILASNVTSAGDGQPTYKYASITVPAGCTLAVTYTIGADGGAFFNLYACDDFSTFYFQEAFIVGSGSFSTPALAEGTYIIEILTFEGSGGVLDSSMTIVGDADFVVNPAVALWDDSGTTRQLDACPKFLLPPLTESDGEWYADEAEAQSVLDFFTGDCLVYSAVPNGFGPRVSLVVTYVPGTSLAIVCDAGTSGNELDCSLNLDALSVLTLNYSMTSPSSPTGVVEIYDYAGILLDFAVLSSGTGMVTLGSGLPGGGLPYSGRYTVVVQSSDAPGLNVTLDLAYTSSGALTANPIQPLYDVGLNCPARLDCS